MLDKKCIELLNYRIQQEEFSSRLYEQMSLWLDNKGYLNLSKLYDRYAQEELTHASWAKKYLLDYGINPSLKALPSPYVEYGSVKEIFDATLEHELQVTKQCEDLANHAVEEKYHVLYSLALKYCAEQQEEIGKAITLLDICKLTSDQLLLDTYVGEKLL